jgi:predicted alpha/beta superfamily hydrolase
LELATEQFPEVVPLVISIKSVLSKIKKMKLKVTILLAFAFIQIKGFSQTPTFDLKGSEVRKITSSIVKGQEYDLHIMVPAGYQKSDKKYPVLYLMDSQWDFPLVTALYGQQYFDGFVPSIIIVGITWGGTNPNPDSLRARDYTPTNDRRQVQSGGAEKFLSFIKNEAFPFIESNYRVDNNNRTLMGCSLGGLFTLYTLFTQPDLFQKYVAASPAFAWDSEVLYQYEKKYSENKSNPAARLFMCVGGVERGVPGFEKLSKHLQSRHYPSLQIKPMVLENIGHSGTKGEGYERGMQYVFERPSISVGQEVLKQYAGSYSMPNGKTAEVKVENNQLVLYNSPTNKFPLLAATDTDFYSTAEFLNLKFKKEGNNKVSILQLETYNGVQSANKEK